MNPHQLSPINVQLLALEREYGAEEASRMALRSVIHLCSANHTGHSIRDQILELYQLAWQCKPKMATIIHDLQKLLVRIETQPQYPSKQHAEDLLAERTQRSTEVVRNALPLIEKASNILLFAYSGTVFSCLEESFRLQNKPKVWLATSSATDTERIVNLCEKHRVEFELNIDPTTIAHIVHEICLALFGAMACCASEHLVVDAGTAAIVTQLHEAHVPIYATLATDKFSAWKGTGSEACIEAHRQELATRQLVRYAYSHDLVSCVLFTGLITELGVLGSTELPEILARRRQEFRERELCIEQNQTSCRS